MAERPPLDERGERAGPPRRLRGNGCGRWGGCGLRIATSDPPECGMRLGAAGHDDVAGGVDPGIEARRHEGRGLGLDDQGRAAHRVSRYEVGPAVADSLRRVPRVVECQGPLTDGRGRGEPRAIAGARRSLGGRGDAHRPVHHLDLHARDDATVQAGVVGLEGGDQVLDPGGIERASRNADLDLVTLAAIAHERGAGHGERGSARAGLHDRCGLPAHVFEQRIHRRRVEVGNPDVVAAHQLERHRSRKEPDRGPGARIRGDDDFAHPDLLRHARGMQGTVPAERDHRAVFKVLSLLHRVHARRVGHGLVHHLRYAVGAIRRAGAEAGSDVTLDGAAGEIEVEPQASVRKGVGVEIAGHRVGIGHRRSIATAPVAGGSWIGARAAGSDAQSRQLVDARDGAAAGSDLDHLGHRDPHRQAAALDEPLGPRDLECTRGARLAVLDEAHLRGRSSHVERQRMGASTRSGDPGGEDRAAARPRLDQPDGEREGGRERRHAAAGGHEVERAVEATFPETAGEILQVSLHQRLDAGVGHRRGEPVELANLGRHLAGEADRECGMPARDDVADGLLVRRIGAGVQQADCETVDAAGHQRVDRAVHAFEVERLEDLPVRGNPLRDGRDPLPRHQGVGLLDVEVVLVVAALVGDLEDVPEPLRDDGADGRAGALDQGVGGERGPVNDRADVRRGEIRPCQRQPHPIQHPPHRIVRCGEHLAGEAGAVTLDRHVGESAADVDGEPGPCHPDRLVRRLWRFVAIFAPPTPNHIGFITSSSRGLDGRRHGCTLFRRTASVLPAAPAPAPPEPCRACETHGRPRGRHRCGRAPACRGTRSSSASVSAHRCA